MDEPDTPSCHSSGPPGILFKFHQHVVQILVWRDFRLMMPASAMVYIKFPRLEHLSKFDIKTLLCYHCWCWGWKSNVFPYIPEKVFVPYAGKIWIKLYFLNYTKIWAFWKKGLFKTISDEAFVPFWKKLVYVCVFFVCFGLFFCFCLFVLFLFLFVCFFFFGLALIFDFCFLKQLNGAKL